MKPKLMTWLRDPRLPEEVRSWCDDAALTIERWDAEGSGISVRARSR